VYARTVSGRELTFGVSGMLWRDNLIMYDRQTDSWWAQATGTAIHGPLKGQILNLLPSDMMTWKQWRGLHPRTTVLSKRTTSGIAGTTDRCEGYHARGGIGVTGRTKSAGALDPKVRVLGFRLDGRPFAAVLDDLKSNPVLRVDAAPGGVVVVAKPDRSGAKAFRTGGRQFEAAGTEDDRTMMRDRETGSRWDGYEGLAVSGPLKGQRLSATPAFVSYWFSWRSFFPDSEIVRR
jgi:hypothetical protein